MQPVTPDLSSSRRRVFVGVGFSIAAFGLMVGWNFIPASVTYEGTQITCRPASVDRSSDASDLDGRELPCAEI